MDGADTIKPDVELWDDFLSGSEEAFKTIYDGYVRQLYKFGQHFTKNEDLIFDAVQDVFIDLYNYRANLKSTNNIKLYLFLSLKRKILRLMGEENKYLPIDSEKLAFSYSLVSHEDENIEDSRLKFLDEALSELSDRQREAIYLRYIVGLSYDELAGMLHLNYQSARNLIHRAMEKLKKSCQGSFLCLLLFRRLAKK